MMESLTFSCSHHLIARNNAASVFGEQKRLEPMSPERKTRWTKEIDWLLSVTDHIVEFVPSQQSKDGINMEVQSRTILVFFYDHV